MSMTDEEIQRVFGFSTPFDGLTDEEIMFWATPYFDVIQEQKKLKEQRIEGEVKQEDGQ